MINNKEKKMIQRYCIYPKIAVVALIFSFVQCALIVPLEMIDDLVFQNKGFQPTGMFTACLLYTSTYLADLNEQCLERRDFLMEQIMEQEGITEELKSRDQMEWVRRANNARSRVDEIILNELVYV